jgi:sugar phosphate isomerase/epimerase
MGPEGSAAQAALDAGRQLIDTAAQLGSRTALIVTGDCKPGEDRAEGRALVGHRLGALLPHAHENNVVLTIEPRGSLRSPYQTGAECLEVCELAGPDMMIAYDDGNMVLGDEDPVHFLNVAGSRVAHAHAKDWMALPPDAQKGIPSRAGKRVIGTVVGQGILDYPRILAALKAIGYQGFLSFEYEGERDPIEAAREGMAYLRKQLQSL